MPYSNNSGGPWGGGGKGGGKNGGGRGPWGNDDDRGNRGGGGGGGQGGGGKPPVPDLDDLVRKGREQLQVMIGGRSGGGGGGGGGPEGLGRGSIVIGVLALAAVWVFMSFYTVKPEEKSVELFLGKESGIGEPGLNFAPWPVVTKEILAVTRENTEFIGVGRGSSGDDGLMLTGDENIIDIDFQVVWNIADPSAYLFNLADPEETIQAVSQSAMREVIARSQLAPILNRDRGVISDEVQELIQQTLSSYNSGVNIIRLNFDKADPPREVIESFLDVQRAEQDRNTLQNQADAYANQALARARGESAQMLEQAEGYRAQVVNEAQGEASRFVAVYDEYSKAEEVTRKRLYIETLESVLGGVDKIIIDEGVSGGSGGQGVVPYLPLNELRRGSNSSEGTN